MCVGGASLACLDFALHFFRSEPFQPPRAPTLPDNDQFGPDVYIIYYR
jgi:hypothetical protein